MVVESEVNPPSEEGQEPQQQQQQQRQHKIPVPTNYRTASKILRRAVEERCNVKTLVLEEKHFRKGKGLAMMDMILVNLKRIEELLSKTELLSKEPRLNPWLAKVLVAELMFGRGDLTGESIPVQCVKGYKEALQEAMGTLDESTAPAPKQLDFKEPRYVRINTNVLAQPGAIRLLQDEGWVLVDEEFPTYGEFLERVKTLGDSEFLVDFHFKEVLVFPNSAKNYWARATELKQKFVLQNKACVLPTYLLNPPKKSVVLDMCAAPGLKTTHLANLMKNKGRIYAVERDANRYKLLCEYAADFGVIKAINDDCMLVGEEQAPGVEYILLDPSCSGSGMSSRLRLNEEYDKQRLYKLGGLQYKLLCHAMNAFPSVKRIVYSTCSIFPEENEEIVQGALKHNGHFKLVDAKALLDKEWLNFGSPDYPGIGEKCLYARSDSDLTIGMFVAVFERCGEEEEYNEVYQAHEKQKQSYDNLSKMGYAEFNGKKDKGKKRKQQHQQSREEQEPEPEQEEVVQQETLPETSEDHTEAEVCDPPKKKKKKSKSAEMEAPEQVPETAEAEPESVENEVNGEKKSKKKKKKSKDVESNAIVEESNVTTADADQQEVTNDDDGSIKKTKKKKKKHHADEEAVPVEEAVSVQEQQQQDAGEPEESTISKKKKKKKSKSDEPMSVE